MSKLPEANGHRSVRRCPRTVSMVMLRAPGLAYNRRMKEKEQIVENWLPRYTGMPLEQFGEHILLTNFGGYLDHFARLAGAQAVGADRPMPRPTADRSPLVHLRMGRPHAPPPP